MGFVARWGALVRVMGFVARWGALVRVMGFVARWGALVRVARLRFSATGGEAHSGVV
jgi:hypothetical protein